MKQKLIVFSMDAMVEEDVEYLKNKPGFKELFGTDYAQVMKVQSIYPSLTYPAHTSIITGCYAGEHGITDNNPWTTKKREYPVWYIDSSAIKRETLFDVAKKNGNTTASVYWPVTGNLKSVDYLIDEVFQSWVPNESLNDAYKRLGTSDEVLRDIVAENNNRQSLNNRKEIGLNRVNTSDHFINGCACSMIKHYNPDLLLIHNSYIDTARHRYGVFNDKITEGLDFLDQWLFELVRAMKDNGSFEDTNFVLISDHGQMDFARRFRLNTKFVRDNMIKLDEQNNIVDWKLYSKSGGMCVFVYVKDPKDTKECYEYLLKLRDEGVWGFSKVRTREETKEEFKLDGDFAFVLETDGFTAFADPWTEPIYNPIDFSDYRLGNATHGYEPQKGPQPVFVAKGPAFKKNARLDSACIVDEGPTFAKILGTRLENASGRVLSELLNLN